MKQDYPQLSREVLCRLFGKTRHAYYDHLWRAQRINIKDDIILQQVLELRKAMPRLGTRKLLNRLQPTLLSHDIQIGRDYLFDLLDAHRLLIRKRKRKIVTTNSRHRYRKYPNLIRHLSITRPEQVWVSDMTYIQVQNKWSYLSLITDAYSRKIMGYCFREDMKAIGCLTALKMAIARRSYSEQTLIHHSDRASQYACEDSIKLLDHNHIDISMTEKSDPYENALAERINGIIKDEFSLYQSKLNFELTYQHIIKSIDTYNGSRPHASCNYLTPNEAHLCQGELKKRWKKYSRPQWIQRPDKNPKYYE